MEIKTNLNEIVGKAREKLVEAGMGDNYWIVEVIFSSHSGISWDIYNENSNIGHCTGETAIEVLAILDARLKTAKEKDVEIQQEVK